MQKYGQDFFGINFFSFTCYDTVSTYDSIIISPHIKCSVTSAFYMYVMHNTTYDIFIMASLN
jgi:hypothetical protein